jgi:iron complex transport system substrate-binding protein
MVARAPRRALFALLGVLSGGAGEAATESSQPGAPATRIVTLAPHLAEMAYAAGAGDRLVGTVAFSDEPPAARALPRVGDAFRVDYEQVLALRPDLVLGWTSGNPAPVLARLRGLGLRVVDLEPAALDDIGSQIALIGQLAGTPGPSGAAAREWAAGLAALRARGRGVRPVTVFYQVAAQPLVTVTDAHFLGQALRLCGGRNVFGGLPGLAPVVDREAVIAARPEMIFVSLPASPGGESPAGAWRQWRDIPAVAGNRIVEVDPAVMSIPGPRLLGGIGRLCDALDGARGGTP